MAEETMRMAEDLWGPLPTELVQYMLSFLPVPALHRLRTVCKAWDSMITKLEFGALVLHHARRQPGRLLVLREERGWSFLDLEERRWYAIKHDARVVFRPLIRIDSMDMQGGLLCHHRARESLVFVSNPVASTAYRRLPPCPALTDSVVKPVLNLVVDELTRAFKVLVIPNGPEGEPASVVTPRMVVYESTTNEWRNSRDAQTPLLGFPFRATCSAFLEDSLYVLMSPLTSKRISVKDCLWCYDHVQDLWRNVSVDIPFIRSMHYPQLVVSGGRLFLASWMQKTDLDDQTDLSFKTWPWVQENWSYEILEVDFAQKTCRTVFQMKEEEMRTILEAPSVEWRRFSTVHLKAFGCHGSIVLLCVSTGLGVLLDLRTLQLEDLPAKSLPPVELDSDGRPDPDCDSPCIGVAKPMNLILPGNTLWMGAEAGSEPCPVFHPERRLLWWLS